MAIGLAPVQRCLDFVLLQPGPAVAVPVLRLAIATGCHELQVISIAYRTAGEGESLIQDLPVARCFIVKAKASGCIGANTGDAVVEPDPLQGAGISLRVSRFPHRRRQRIVAEGMQQVGQQQFLMLLFMVHAQPQQFQQLLCCRQLRQHDL